MTTEHELSLKDIQEEEELKTQALVKHNKKKPWYKKRWIPTSDDFVPRDDTFARVINITGTAITEQVMRAVGQPYSVKIINLKMQDEKFYIIFHRETDPIGFDLTQPPGEAFNA